MANRNLLRHLIWLPLSLNVHKSLNVHIYAHNYDELHKISQKSKFF